MVRFYKRKESSRPYKLYEPEQLEKALEAIEEGWSYRKTSSFFKISTSTLLSRVKRKHTKQVGGSKALTDKEEKIIVNYMIVCSDWDMPLSSTDVLQLVTNYLRVVGKNVEKFKNNIPSKEWYYCFLARHKRLLHGKTRNGQIKFASPLTCSFSLDNLKEIIQEVLPENILFFDEINLTADLENTRKTVCKKRFVKYPDEKKVAPNSISVMFTSTGVGEMLPCYVVYNSSNLCPSWTEGGPPGTLYGQSSNGWFDRLNFEKWFGDIVIPWAKSRPGVKCIVGDNLKFFVSSELLCFCVDEKMRCVLIPPKFFHLCHPFIGVFFNPCEQLWKQVLVDYRTKNTSIRTVEKSGFPQLLNGINCALKGMTAENLKKALEKLGVDCYRQEVLEQDIICSQDSRDSSNNSIQSIAQEVNDGSNKED